MPTDPAVVRAVLDTNAVVSAILSPFGAPARLLNLVLAGPVLPCYDGRILAEYRDVLARPKFAIAPRVSMALVSRIAHIGLAVTPTPVTVWLPDNDDRAFVEVAEAAAATLVTGNPRHFPAIQRATSVAAFLTQLT
ncbi:MAG: putative toxin-antitoxin system toxin component, PIN family [Bifidobacteriaceae bacterium]|nr:putative toxin-antitoxin system toxin component, PIN family [Bifidobacteriaceae bacterium]